MTLPPCCSSSATSSPPRSPNTPSPSTSWSVCVWTRLHTPQQETGSTRNNNKQEDLHKYLAVIWNIYIHIFWLFPASVRFTKPKRFSSSSFVICRLIILLITLFAGVQLCRPIRAQFATLVCQVVTRLPKTRSGKIMRRILRKVAMETTEDLGDVSTLDDPSVVKEIIEAHEAYRKQRQEEKKK